MRAVAASLLLSSWAELVSAIRVASRSNDSSTLRTWEEANLKAQETFARMQPNEMIGMLRGSHWHWQQMGPEWGFFVGNTAEVRRLGVPGLKMQDAGQGFRPTDPHEVGTTTSWPCLLALASTWDEKLVGEVASAIGEEFAGKGANVMLGPSVNVHRTALNGRNFEYLSGEDPYLGARLVDDFVQGVQSQGVMATLKHFAFNEQETNRMAQDSVVDDRTAWELYYPPFEAAVKAGAGAVMCSYNKVNGTYACQNQNLLMRDLKGKMGFQGLVMSDWAATHTAKSIENGLDIEMPGYDFKMGELSARVTEAKIRKHNVSQSSRDTAVRRTLATIYRLRLDEKMVCYEAMCSRQRASDQATPEHAALAQRAATNAVTMLKNDNVLPIEAARIKKLGVVGQAAVATQHYYAGGGSGFVPGKYVVTPLEGIQKRAQLAGIEVVNMTQQYMQVNKLGRRRTLYDLGTEMNDVDAIIVFAGATASEGVDRRNLELDDSADNLIYDAISTGKPTIVCMMTPGAVLTPWRAGATAIANLFLAGQETGNSWAAVLFGDEPPRGKLPILFPATSKDVIKPGSGKVKYSEGLFTSYRSDAIQAAFPFGHGLSYTALGFSPAEALPGGSEACPGVACVLTNITNVGRRDGSEVAQAYIEFAESAEAPAKVLRGFQKTRVLKPGEMETVIFAFTERDLSIYDTGVQGWVPQRKATVHIGSSSESIRHSIDLLL
mmetsp:Transcript_20888/g.58978  ORF Transcript_20888/g.58978 Transcript_20888/m.58978 type:complete len:720 (+) Transcript_20888:75-2234(+)